MPILKLVLDSGEDSLDVRRFIVHEGMSQLFEVQLFLRSRQENIDLEKTVGKGGAFWLASGISHAASATRMWSGIVNHFEQVQAEVSNKGLSSYTLRVVPWFWQLTQRRNHRIFQHVAIPDIVDSILAEWGLAPDWKIDRVKYHKLEYRVQYGESDYVFVSRLLEEAGICFYFVADDDKGSILTFSDSPETNEPRAGFPLPYADNPNQAANREFITQVRLAQVVRPGAVTLRDFDFRRKPDYQLLGKAVQTGDEAVYEQYQYRPGAMVIDDAKGGGTPVADDKGVARNDDKQGADLANKELLGIRAGQRIVQYATNVIDLAPGSVFSMANHPRSDLSMDTKLLVTEFDIDATPNGEWRMRGLALFADQPYRPISRTPKPVLTGLQSAIVVGPAGEEIYTDEFGRVRVQFHWDREGKWNESSSCWMRVSQGWAGHGFGMITIPRIGHEVLVGFFEGDPDQPVIVGRVYNNTARVPYKLPDNKTKSTWKSDSSPGSGGFNEIMFEDAKGKELIYIQAQKDLHKLVKHDESEQIGNDRQVTVGNNRTTNVGKVDSLVVGTHHSVQISPPSKDGGGGGGGGTPTGLDMIDKKLTYTTGDATLMLDGANVSVEAKGDITIKSTGGDVVILGKLVKINSP
ncbi:MAG TPA: type VI secretion system tip protein TssI/VgrG [Polyangia bacterium]|jgi:type VI secretion system secreted protein VgrG|nr:type VI secretion system tip protein TssI/VgrG [Polyangia bacterium]